MVHEIYKLQPHLDKFKSPLTNTSFRLQFLLSQLSLTEWCPVMLYSRDPNIKIFSCQFRLWMNDSVCGWVKQTSPKSTGERRTTQLRRIIAPWSEQGHSLHCSPCLRFSPSLSLPLSPSFPLSVWVCVCVGVSLATYKSLQNIEIKILKGRKNLFSFGELETDKNL